MATRVGCSGGGSFGGMQIAVLYFLLSVFIIGCSSSADEELEHEQGSSSSNGVSSSSESSSSVEQPPEPLESTPVRFSEVYSANTELEDEYGNDPGWVELHNTADTAFNLLGLFLSDGKKSWAFGSVKMESNAYLVVFLSGKNKNTLTEGGNIHSTLELNESGGTLKLQNSLGTPFDSCSYPTETKNLSYAKNFESGKWALSNPPTPGAANTGTTYDEQAKPPEGIPNSGYFETSLSFTLPAEGGQGKIYCDTTGARPSENSNLSSGTAVNLTRTVVMRCAQYKNGAFPSEVILRTYIVNEQLSELPIVSIAVNPDSMFDGTIGLYMEGPNAEFAEPHYGANYWSEDELPIQIDFFENGAQHAWSYPACLKMFGNWSRANAKKSVAIGFKEKYGQKNIKYPLFPDYPHLTKFKWFILRSGGNSYSLDYIRDMLMTSLTEGLGLDYQKGRSVVVYYNGKYYGIHKLRERANSDYFETNYGIDENNIDLVKRLNIERSNGVHWEASKGSDADWLDIMNYLETTTLDDSEIEKLEKRIDIDNFTNYMQSEIYFANLDWPGNNMKMWRSTVPLSKWKWVLYDTDFGFDWPWGDNRSWSTKMLQWVTAENSSKKENPPSSTLLMRRLLENENYKNAFINRFSLLLATQFEPSKVASRITELMAPIESEIPRDQNRWGFSAYTMDAELNTIRNFGKNRPAAMQKELESFFALGTSHNLTVSKSGNGEVKIHNLLLPSTGATFKAYESVPLVLEAVGSSFKGWSDGAKENKRVVYVDSDSNITANF